MGTASNDGRTVWIERISGQLGTWVNQVEIAIKNNLPNINVTSETIVEGLLNRMYDWKLVNANSKAQNFPGVDLVDEDECIAVQVTSTNSVEKVDNTLEKFFAHKLEKRFDKVLIVVITNQNPTNGMKKRQWEPWFDGAHDVWNIPGLLRKMNDLEVKRLEEISGYLARELGLAAPAEKPEHLLPGVPAASSSFVRGSRDRELDRLEQALEQGPVFIWGLGGIGKTETAIQLANRCAPPRGAYFLHYYYDAPDGTEALRETILRANFTGYCFEGQDNEKRAREYRERMDILRSEYAGTMLIIDNFDRPGKTLADLRGEPAYQELTAMEIRLVFTTRNEVPAGGVEIKPLRENLLLELMRESCPGPAVSDNDLRALIRAVEGHTLMVDLMAKTLTESWGDITARRMLDALKNSELDQPDFPEVVADRNRRERQRKLYAHLKALFDLSGMSGEDRSILCCATLLPEDGMQARLFRDCLPNGQHQLLRNLIKRGWLRYDGEKLTIHPVIREVCRAELKPCDADCGSFLNRLWRRFDSRTFFDARLYWQIARYYAAAVEQLEDRKGNWVGRTGWYWRRIGIPQTALIYDLRFSAFQEKRRKRNYYYLAVGYQNIGIDYSQLADYQKALDYHQKALYIRERKLPRDPAALAKAHSSVSYCYNDLGETEKALEHILKALEICRSVTPVDELALASYYNSTGYTYCDLREYSKALEYQGKALEIRERLLRPGHPAIATTYSNMGYEYFMLGDYETALKHQQKALDIRKAEMLPDNYAVAVSLNDVGYSLTALGDCGQSMECFQEAVRIFQKTLPADHRYLASSFQGIGEALEKMGEYRRALTYLDRALEIRKKKFPAGHRYILETQNVIDRVRKAQQTDSGDA